MSVFSDPVSYRLGVDLGANSIGWHAVRVDEDGFPIGILDAGVRILSPNEEAGRDPKSKASLAADRTLARSMRRNRDRKLLRKSDLMAELVAQGLMPQEESDRKALESLDPYRLRAEALDKPVPLFHLGRALFHLHQRRGFKSNRRTDKGDADAGQIRQGIDRLQEALKTEGARTFGEYLWGRHARREAVRVRQQGSGAKAFYEFYPERALVEQEFDVLWAAQSPHHPELSEEAKAALKAIIFRQRPLREMTPGRCTLYPEEQRVPKALPSAHRVRIYQELGNLKIRKRGHGERHLSWDERERLAAKLLAVKDQKFTALHKALKLAEDESFNLADEKRSALKGDVTGNALAKKEAFGKPWHDLSLERQDEIVARLLDDPDEVALLAWLQEDCGLDAEAALKVARTKLEDGYGRLSQRALLALAEAFASKQPVDGETGEVCDRGLMYAEAVEAIGLHHSDFREDLLPRLPYYGRVLQRHVAGSGDPKDRDELRFGRIGNVTVHIGLNQLRKLINALISAYGPPAQIHLELARELKLSQEQKKKRNREQAENQKANEKRRAVLAEHGQLDNADNRLRLRLYDELPAERKLCAYSGRAIGVADLFGGQVDIDHILPFGASLDDSFPNKVLCYREWNRQKGRRSPYQAFGQRADWEEILARAYELLPKNKAARFEPDALDRFEGERDFIARQLTDTQYLARVSREYLARVSPDVVVTPGRLTAMIRGKWGLNALLPDHNYANVAQPKNRKDHRHHAIDAFVVAITDRGLLNRIARAADEGEERERLIAEMPTPERWPGFRDDLRQALDGIVVSHRPDHGIAGCLHEETAYGEVRDPAAEEGSNLVFRKPLVGLTEKEIGRIRDRELRSQLQALVADAKARGRKLEEALHDFSETHGVRRVRLLKSEEGVVAVRHGRDGRHRKAYIPGSNHCIEIFERPDGTWDGEAVTVFQANCERHVPRWRRDEPDARLVMRVHKGDLVALEEGGGQTAYRVVRLSISNKILYLAPHNEAGELAKRHDDNDDPFRWNFASFGKLKAAKAQRLRIDVLGRFYLAPEDERGASPGAGG